jgi:phage tail-like protein
LGQIDLFDEQERKIASYRVLRCWPSEYEAIAGLDADSDSIAIERLRLENEGWERDTAVTPPP